MNDEFCYLLRVRYSECDAQKVVFNGRYSDYVDIAVSEFVRVIWGDYNDILSSGIDNQVVSYSINWSAPAYFDEVLAITVKPLRIGNSSYELQVDFYRHDNQEPIASAKIVYVMVSVDQYKKMQIPDDVRNKLEKAASGVVVDHAGLNSNTQYIKSY